MEKKTKFNLASTISLIIGSIAIITGLLLLIIYGSIHPNFSCYYNNQVIKINNENKYSNSYNLLNEGDYIFLSEKNTESNQFIFDINQKIYLKNEIMIKSSKNIMLNIELAFNIENKNNIDNLKNISAPKLELTQDNTKTTFYPNLNNYVITINEFKIRDFNKPIIIKELNKAKNMVEDEKYYSYMLTSFNAWLYLDI